MSRKTYQTTCSYCGVGCGLLVHQDTRGNLSVEGDPNHPVNRGMLCSKGMNLHYTVMDTSDRLLHPEMRLHRQAPLQRVSWAAALDRAAAVFQTLIRKYGPDSVGFYVSGQCLTEEYYLVNKLTKGFLGTNNLDTNSRLCMSSAVVGYKMALGEDSVPISYEDVELADCFLIAGANPAWCHPILFRRMEAAKAQNPDVKWIVVDPRKTQTAQMADLHLQINPGTDVVLYHAIARGLMEREKIDEAFIRNHTEGFEAFREKVMERTPAQAARICGVSVDDIRWAVEYAGRAKGLMTMWAMGLNQSVIGVNKNLALINLNLITGQIGKPGAGPFSLTGQPNAMGGREVGGLATMLAAHRDLANPLHRKEVADFWGVPAVPEKPGYTATEMFEALHDGRMKAIWIICTNPLVSLPDAHRAEEALRRAKFVVVQDISNRSDTVPFADLVLPAAAWAEKSGTMTNSERRISYLNPVVAPPGEARPDAEILWRFARKMGFENAFPYTNVSQVYDEHVRLTKGTRIDISGLSHHRLREQGTVQWPVPTAESPGTPRLFTDGQFYRPNGRAKIHTVADENASEPLSPEFPLVLTTGRIRDQWHTMTKTGKVNKLKQHIDQPTLDIHPADAAVRGIAAGDPVVIASPRGTVQVTATLTKDIKKGVVFLPMHWGKILNQSFGRTNNLTHNLVDPVSKEPDFKFSAVQVTKYVKPKQKIIVIGAGAGAYRFVTRHRERNAADEIHVFCRERFCFYNRVLLPDYLSGELPWERLLTLTEAETQGLNVRVHHGLGIQKIDRERKIVVDAHGGEHAYDLLILATGSRATVLRHLDLNLAGVFTMRTRPDADALKAYTQPGDHVLIIGGGLLGLELAASLRHVDRRVTVVQRAGKLMDRQLDDIGSRLLHEEMTERGIDIYYHNEVKYLTGKDRVTGVRLASGETLACQAVVMAVGTTPNAEMAREAGLLTNRGVVVNEYLQTSDHHIFALGEVAEFNGTVFGISAAAEEQADVLVDSLAGDRSHFYRGTLLMNILKMAGLHLCSLGTVTVPPHEPGYEEVIFTDLSRRYYKKCIVYRDRLVGAILFGDKAEFQEYKELIVKGTELSEKRLGLLRAGQSTRAGVLGKLICSCHDVGEGNLRQAVENGCRTLPDLCQATGAGTGCGSCRPEVKAVLESATRQAKPLAAIA